MSTSFIDLSEHTDLIQLAEVVCALRQAAPVYEPLLVGAMARDVLLSYAHSVPITRATMDVDLAFAVAGWEDYECLSRQLLTDERFSQHNAVPHCLWFRQTVKIDLVPFGGVERPDRSILWPPRLDKAMCVLGCQEALACALHVRLPLGQHLAVVSLPALAILKVVAWRDRRYLQPYKDAFDLEFILRHYLEAGNDERLYREASHLLEQPQFDYLNAGAWLLGHDARQVLQAGEDSARAIQLVIKILAPEIDPEGPMHLAADMRETNPQTALTLLSCFAAGLSGSTDCP